METELSKEKMVTHNRGKERVPKTSNKKDPFMLKTIRSFLMSLVLVALAGLPTLVQAGTPEDLKVDAKQALALLVKANPIASVVSKKAKATLIFPNIVKAGLIFGGAYGEGVVMKGTQFDGYVNSVSVTFGWQAGAQSYGYVVFLMTDKAIQYIRDTQGLEIGVGPTVVVVDEGGARNLSSSTLKDDAYAFIFDQQGLMASLSIEGTKITRIKK